MSAITGICDLRAMVGSASASSCVGTATRTMSQPDAVSSAICCSVALMSVVCVVHIDCTLTGASPPTATLPTLILRVGRRGARTGAGASGMPRLIGMLTDPVSPRTPGASPAGGCDPRFTPAPSPDLHRVGPAAGRACRSAGGLAAGRRSAAERDRPHEVGVHEQHARARGTPRPCRASAAAIRAMSAGRGRGSPRARASWRRAPSYSAPAMCPPSSGRIGMRLKTNSAMLSDAIRLSERSATCPTRPSDPPPSAATSPATRLMPDDADDARGVARRGPERRLRDVRDAAGQVDDDPDRAARRRRRRRRAPR